MDSTYWLFVCAASSAVAYWAGSLRTRKTDTCCTAGALDSLRRMHGQSHGEISP